MEWNRGPGQTQPANQTVGHTAAATHGKSKANLLNVRTASVALLFCLTILMVALVSLLAFNNNSTSSASKDIDKSKMQAVFLNGGQVYFGKITSSDDNFMRLKEIYYLRVNQQVQPDGSAASNQDISLVKLGCELHGPQDNMVINQEQVIFWENLKGDGQVAKAVDEYVKQNPNGQKCDAPAAETTPAPTTPAPATNTNKKP